MQSNIQRRIPDNFSIVLILTFILSAPYAEIPARSNDRLPKIGLVLSGGGALGMAHVGVLKVMEEAGLRPDYITGVSMGSLIGGMYSVGYTADSIYSLLKGTNWDLIFSETVPENKVIFPEKEHFHNSIISLPVSAKKIMLPSGLMNGQQIENQLSYYFWPAIGINDFSRLPIPFMCLGVDLITGRKVELKTGYLPDAVRASIAVPTIFTPIKIDSALLVDGGILRNYAAEEARNMGADIIIGSYTGYRVYTEEELYSMPEIVKRVVFMKSSEDYQNQKKITDILIEPDLQGFSRTEFTYIDSIIDRGYKAALPYKDYFMKLADSLNHPGPREPLFNILDRQFFSFDKIEITGNKIYSDFQIGGVLDLKPGEKIDKNLMSEKMDLLYGKQWFEKVKYRILSSNDSLILVIDCIEEPGIMLYGGVYYDNYIKSGIVFRMTFKDLLTRKSFIDFDSYIARFYRAKLTFLQFIDQNQKFGISTVFSGDNSRLPALKIGSEKGGVFYRNLNMGISLNKYLGLNHLMNISVNICNSSFVPDFNIVNPLKRMTYNFLSENFSYQINTLEAKYFPDRGLLFHLTGGTSKPLSEIVSTESGKVTYNEADPGTYSFKRVYSLSGGFKQYFTAWQRITFSVRGDFLITYDSDSVTSFHNLHYLGGIESLSPRSVPLTGFHSYEVPVNKFIGAGAGLDFEVFKDVHLTLMTDIFAAKENPGDEKVSFFSGFGFGVGYMSIIGPMKIGIMNGLSNNGNYSNGIKGYISIGYSF